MPVLWSSLYIYVIYPNNYTHGLHCILFCRDLVPEEFTHILWGCFCGARGHNIPGFREETVMDIVEWLTNFHQICCFTHNKTKRNETACIFYRIYKMFCWGLTVTILYQLHFTLATLVKTTTKWPSSWGWCMGCLCEFRGRSKLHLNSCHSCIVYGVLFMWMML